jgi:hypothetical protein
MGVSHTDIPPQGASTSIKPEVREGQGHSVSQTGGPRHEKNLKSYRLERGALIYICADQQTGQWLIRAIDNHKLGTGARLKVTDASNLPKPVKVTLRTKDNVAQTQNDLLTWVKT